MNTTALSEQIRQALGTMAFHPAVKEKTLIDHDTELKTLTEKFMYRVNQWAADNESQFVIDAENKEVILCVLQYFSNHPDFITNPAVKNKASLKKGLMICGNVGTGKTLLIKLIESCMNQSDKFLFVPCDMLTQKVMSEGAAYLEKYQSVKTHSGKENVVLFDDLGTEGVAKYYGNTINPMFDLIIKRYRLHTDWMLKTHFTTNLRPDEWSKTYDERTASRLNEMCNIIVLGGKAESVDRRK
jgi:DNA replication protein DnaC